MSEYQLPRDLMERLERVDSKLEELLAHQTLPQDEGLAETQPSTDGKFSEDILGPGPEDAKIRTAAGFSAGSQKPLPFRAAVSALEADNIFQKMEKIHRDVEVVARVEKLERQNRKMVVLGSLFMTLMILILGVSTFLMYQANLLNPGICLKTWQRVNPLQPSSGEAAAKATDPQPPKPVAAVPDPKAAEPIAKASDPLPVATPMVLKPAKATSPGKYVGFRNSNKYHYPDCKWAAGAKPHNLLHFSTTTEARKRGYIPCPTCQPPRSD
jgi:Metal binding domain of Ada